MDCSILNLQHFFVALSSFFHSTTASLNDNMRHRIVDSLIDRHNAKVAPTLRPILKGRNAFRRQSVRQHDRPTFLKGVHNGQFFRIKLPNPSSQVSRLPPLPSILPVPKSLMGLWGEKSKNSLEILFPREGTQDSLFQRLLRWLSFNWPTMLLNFGSVCTLMAFTRSDVLELRTLSATGSISNALYRYTQKPILWITIAWPSLFATVNGVKIIEILHERNAEVHMDEEQERIYVEYFLQHGVTPKVCTCS